jgi:hypothetical protein
VLQVEEVSGRRRVGGACMHAVCRSGCRREAGRFGASCLPQRDARTVRLVTLALKMRKMRANRLACTVTPARERETAGRGAAEVRRRAPPTGRGATARRAVGAAGGCTRAPLRVLEPVVIRKRMPVDSAIRLWGLVGGVQWKGLDRSLRARSLKWRLGCRMCDKNKRTSLCSCSPCL